METNNFSLPDMSEILDALAASSKQKQEVIDELRSTLGKALGCFSGKTLTAISQAINVAETEAHVFAKNVKDGKSIMD